MVCLTPNPEKAWVGRRPPGLCKRLLASPRMSSASSPALQRLGFAQESTVCLFPLVWVLSKFALLPKRDKGSWWGRVLQTGMQSGSFEHGILESCSVRAWRVWTGAFQMGSEAPRSQGKACTRPRFTQGLSLRCSVPNTLKGRARANDRNLKDAGPTSGYPPLPVQMVRGLVQGQEVAPGVLGPRLASGRQGLSLSSVMCSGH